MKEKINRGSDIVIYRTSDGLIKIDVRVENETVWLSLDEMSELFQRNKSTISRHIKNIFDEGELDKKVVVANYATTTQHGAIKGKNQSHYVNYYNLDVIISVGYRVKSFIGVQFRQWANKVLKEYLLRGYAVNQRFETLEDKMDKKFAEQDAKIEHLNKQVDFFVRTSLPPVEGIFHNGQIFDAYKFATDLIKSAKKSLVLIDNYVDESVLLMLSKREAGVSAKIYTSNLSKQLTLDLAKHNKQYPPIEIFMHTTSHDRFLIIDDAEVYHIGASLKDLGKKLFAFSKLNIPPSAIL